MSTELTRVVVATDMSARSDRALERGFQLAQDLNVPLTALLVLDNALPEDLLSPLYEKAQSQLGALCARWANGVEYSVEVQAGDPTEEILRAAGKGRETLLVMGPHRPRPFLDGLRETTMQRIVRRTEAPVILASVPVTGSYAKILSLVDYGPVSTSALKLGAELAPDAEITAAHAVHVPYSGMLETTGSVQMDLQAAFAHDAETQDETWRKEVNLPASLNAKTQISQTPPMGLIEDLNRAGAYDLVTAGAHGRVGAVRSYLGSIALDLMREPPCDVLIAR